MDNKAQVKAHYNLHADPNPSFDKALAARHIGRATPLKDFHNDVKRQMIGRFAKDKGMLLDFCCGRGGDMHKWMKFGVKYVKGVDISEGEVFEAARRFVELRTQEDHKGAARRMPLQAEFEVCSELGEKEWTDGQQYDVVTCNFALHYFFEKERALKMFLHNVALSLKPGGFFMATIPCGKRVLQLLNSRKEDGGNKFGSTMLNLQKGWQGAATSPFGLPNTCAITDTVTEGKGDSAGSSEFLTFMRPVELILATHGMVPVKDYGDRNLEDCFRPGDRDETFKHFDPRFPGAEPSLEVASAMFGAFVFRKCANAPPAVRLPVGSLTGAKRRHEEGLQAEAKPVAKRRHEEGTPGDGA